MTTVSPRYHTLTQVSSPQWRITQDNIAMSRCMGHNMYLLQPPIPHRWPKSANKTPVAISVAGVLSLGLLRWRAAQTQLVSEVFAATLLAQHLFQAQPFSFLLTEPCFAGGILLSHDCERPHD